MADSADVAGDKIERQPRAALGYDICLQWPEGEVRTPPADRTHSRFGRASGRNDNEEESR